MNEEQVKRKTIGEFNYYYRWRPGGTVIRAIQICRHDVIEMIDGELRDVSPQYSYGMQFETAEEAKQFFSWECGHLIETGVWVDAPAADPEELEAEGLGVSDEELEGLLEEALEFLDSEHNHHE